MSWSAAKLNSNYNYPSKLREYIEYKHGIAFHSINHETC